MMQCLEYVNDMDNEHQAPKLQIIRKAVEKYLHPHELNYVLKYQNR